MTGILGFGGYVPSRVMTNADWSSLIDTTDEWITTRTGIKERRFAADDESTLDLSAHAAVKALEDAGISATDLGEIIVATDTPEVYTPDTASILQNHLGAEMIPTYDLGGSGCAGFIQALDVARARIHFDEKYILVVGVELISRLMSWEERSFCVLFGDGAGAMVLGPGTPKGELLDVVTGTDGSKADILTLQTGGTRHPFNQDAIDTGRYQYLDMNGMEVFKEAVRRMPAAVRQVLDRIGKTVDDIDMLIPHQANLRIIEGVGRQLHIDPEKVYVNIQDYGNTGSATVPFATWEAYDKGLIKPGDLVILTAFGAGFHWAAAALQF